MNSAIYRGRVHHRRFWPRAHSFSRALYMVLLDLDELPTLVRQLPFFSVNRRNLLAWHRNDHLGTGDLRTAVRQTVADELGCTPTGPVRVLTQLRVLGYLMNPACFYLCYEADGTTLAAVVVEVENTPWRQRGRYVVRPNSRGTIHFGEAQRVLHLSSFVRGGRYLARLTTPDRRLRLHVNVQGEQGVELSAGLTMTRQPLTARNLWRAQWRYPLMPQMIALGTTMHSLRLLAKGVPIQFNGSDGRFRRLENWIHSITRQLRPAARPAMDISSEVSHARG